MMMIGDVRESLGEWMCKTYVFAIRKQKDIPQIGTSNSLPLRDVTVVTGL